MKKEHFENLLDYVNRSGDNDILEDIADNYFKIKEGDAKLAKKSLEFMRSQSVNDQITDSKKPTVKLLERKYLLLA